VNAFRLLADDLTGALDSAARFVPLFGPIPVGWCRTVTGDAAAYDTANREATDPEPAMLRWAGELRGARLAFLKLDSLLRGHPAYEISACLRLGRFSHAVIAPAFPFQGRITRGGRQYAHGEDVGVDLALDLAMLAVPVSHCRPGEAPAPGVSLWDAVDDGDLDRVVAAGRMLPGPVLWCGSAGLAGALAGRRDAPLPALTGPKLALIGSDHPVSRRQLDASPARVTLHGAGDTENVAALLAQGAAAVDVAIPTGLSRLAAARHMIGAFDALVRALPRPGAAIIAGGGTLRGLCDAIGCAGLQVIGELEPGVPVSIMQGGVWDGQHVVSKSGAFGREDFLARLFGP
jgi:D-threonate/D-erythronate kinase